MGNFEHVAARPRNRFPGEFDTRVAGDEEDLIVGGRQQRVGGEIGGHHDQDDGLDPGLGRGKPVILLAAVEQQLQGAYP